MIEDNPPRRGFRPVYLFLAIPYAVWVWPPFYNRVSPELLGIPFFYWWQMLGIFITALCIVPVYLAQEGQKGGGRK